METTTTLWSMLAGLFLPVVVMAVVWTAKVVNEMWVMPKRLEKHLRRQGLRGNSYRFFYGDLKDSTVLYNQAISKPINISDDIVPRCIPAVHHTLKIHGKNSFLWMGPKPRLIISDPDKIKEIFVRINDFQKPRNSPLTRVVATGIATYDGQKWEKHRRLINPAFQQDKLKKMLGAFYESCSKMIGKWERLASSCGEEGLCEVVNVWPDLMGFTRDVISRTAFGSSYEEGTQIFQLLEHQATLVTQILSTFYIPGWRFVPTKLNKTLSKNDREITASLKGIINRRMKAIEKGEVGNDDLLDLLLESNLREIKDHGGNKSSGISLEDVMEECKLFFFAGQETTSVLLVWTLVLLAQHQDWQARAREEVFSVFGKGKPVDVEGLNRLNIVWMILNEVLRMYPPATMIFRSVPKETKLGDTILPAGAEVAVPVILVHHDPKLWGNDAKEFQPTRFAGGVSEAEKNNQVWFLPFGRGPRVCVGQNFTMLEAKLALAMILQNFTSQLSPSYAHAPHMILTLQPQHGVQVILHKI